MKAYVLDESENFWSGFLLDKDCDSEIVKREFPGTSATRIEDPAIVADARDNCQTIVTSNETDFIRFTLEAQKRDNSQMCEDCWGFLILPNKDFIREYALRRPI